MVGGPAYRPANAWPPAWSIARAPPRTRVTNLLESTPPRTSTPILSTTLTPYFSRSQPSSRVCTGGQGYARPLRWIATHGHRRSRTRVFMAKAPQGHHHHLRRRFLIRGHRRRHRRPTPLRTQPPCGRQSQPTTLTRLPPLRRTARSPAGASQQSQT